MASSAPAMQRVTLPVSKQLRPWRRYATYAISGTLLLRLFWPSLWLAYVLLRLRRRIRALNASGALRRELQEKSVLPLLAKLDLQQALRILQRVGDEAGNIADPNAYVATASNREKSLERDRARPERERTEASPRIRQKIWDLNARKDLLSKELRFDACAPALQPLGTEKALAIFKELEENAAQVADPTNYILEAARKAGSTFAAPSPEARASYCEPADADARLKKRIRWLNDHASEVGLQAQIMYKDVAPDLLHIGHRESMTVLKELENNASSITSPTDWVMLQALSRFK